MDTELVREKLRIAMQMIADIQALLPDELPPKPRLVMVKGGDDDIGNNLLNMKTPSRAREGVPIITAKRNELSEAELEKRNAALLGREAVKKESEENKKEPAEADSKKKPKKD